LDVLAGSGVLRVEGDIFPGSAIVALAAETTSPHFEKYYFIESDMAKATLLKSRLDRVAASLQNKQYEVTKENCNVALPRILNEIYRADPEHSCFLALLDPEGYTETEWYTVETLLSRGKGDMIFNFTEGVARNVEKAKTDASYISSLRKYFGEAEENLLRLEGYEQLIDHFGTKLTLMNAIRRTVFRIDVRDEENRPLYGLLLATGSTGFANIMNDLKRRLDSTRSRELKNIYYELTGRSKSLDNYR
jgi:three-Cys-motif partner protein